MSKWGVIMLVSESIEALRVRLLRCLRQRLVSPEPILPLLQSHVQTLKTFELGFN